MEVDIESPVFSYDDGEVAVGDVQFEEMEGGSGGHSMGTVSEISYTETANPETNGSDMPISGQLFRTHFWAKDKAQCFHCCSLNNTTATTATQDERAGYDILESASGASAECLAQLAAFLSERADAEEQHAKRLRKLLGDGEFTLGTIPPALSAGNNDLSAGVRELLVRLGKEVTGEAEAHKVAADAFRVAACKVAERCKAYKSNRKAALADGAAVYKEKCGLEASVRKQWSRYEEATSKWESQSDTVKLAEASGKSASEVTKQRVKLQKAAKDEMVADQDVKESINKLRRHHPQYVATTNRMMDKIEKSEEERLDMVKSTFSEALLLVSATFSATKQNREDVVAICDEMDVGRELNSWVEEKQTGARPSPPPVYVPRTQRSSLSEAVKEGSEDIKVSPSLSSVASLVFPGSPVEQVSPETTPEPSQKDTAKAIRTFIGDRSDEIDFFKDEIITVISLTTDFQGWGIGKSHGRIGWFPASFVKQI